MIAEPGNGLSDRRSLRCDDEPGLAIVDDIERATGIGRRDHRLLGEERLVRPHPEVLVDRRVVDGEAAGVEIGKLVARDATTKVDTPVQTALARDLSQSLAVRPVADDNSAQRGVERDRFQQQVDPLRAIEATRREHEVAVPLAAVREILRRMRDDLGNQTGRALEPPGDVLRDREEARRLAKRYAIQFLHLPPHSTVLHRFSELAEVGAVELVRLPELVDQPHALLGMTHDVRRELRREHEIDLLPVRLVEVEHPPEERLRQHLRTGVPLERDGHEVGLVPAGAQLADERVGHDLRAAACKRHLRPADRDSHGVGRRSWSSASNRSTCSCRSSTSLSATALNERWS